MTKAKKAARSPKTAEILKIIFQTALAWLSILVILALCYLFGWPVLEGYLKGNDNGFYLAVSEWVAQSFPNLPQWYPFAGGGVSLVQSIQMGAYYFVPIMAKISSLSLIQSIRSIEFASIFIICLELYFFCWYFFKRQAIAFLAAIFFTLSQAIWSLVIDIGMLPQTFSLILVLPVLFSYEFFCEQKKGRWLALAAFGFGLAALTHLLTGILLVEGLVFYGLFKAILKKKHFFKLLLENLFRAGLIVILGLGLVLFWFAPFLRYLGIASRNVFVTLSFEQLNFVDLIHLFGFDQANIPKGNEMWEAFLALPVLVLAFLGFLISVFKKDRFVILLGILFLLFLIHSALPGLAPFIVKLLMVSSITGTYGRAWLISLILMPILAAWACSALSELFLKPLKKLPGVRLVLPILTLLVAFVFVFLFSRAPAYYNVPCYRGLGMGWIPEIDYCHFSQKLSQIKPLSGKGVPADDLTSDLSQTLGLANNPASQVPSRIDISPNWGAVIMNWPRFSSSSIVSLYSFTSGLNNIFTGYFGSVFYNPEAGAGTAREVANLASWFGVEKVILHPKENPMGRFSSDYWKPGSVYRENEIIIHDFKKPTGLATLGSWPRILVLGRFDKRAYEQVFRLSAAGALDYGRAMLIEGKDSGRVDDYSLQDLKEYEMVLLYGYGYRDQKKAFDLLEKYVQAGGRLFIETGWQYVSPDWEWEKTAAVIPVEGLDWQEFQGEWKSQKMKRFSPADYRGGPWGVSVAEKSQIRSWAKPLLTVDDHLLMARGDFGQGKVVWSGMNLIGHAFLYQNKAEIDFVYDQFEYLLKGIKGEDKTEFLKIARPNSDLVEFTFLQNQENNWLYWRENYFPDWKVRLEDPTQGEKKTLPIYRAGPNFILIPLEKAAKGQKVILEMEKSIVFVLAKGVSLIVFLFLLILLANDRMMVVFMGRLTRRLGLSKIKKWWEKE